jgi:cytochrome P450
MTIKLPPGSYGVPFIGQTLAWKRDPLRFLRRRYERYGRIFKSRIYGYREITMLGPEANKFILHTHRDHFEWGGAQEIFFYPKLFGENLFLLDGERHDFHRGLITPAFHGKALRIYFDVMKGFAEKYSERWARKGTIRAFTELRKLTFDIAAKLLLGADTREKTEYVSGLFEALSLGMQAFPRWNFRWTRFGRSMRVMERLRSHFQGVVDERRRAPSNDALSLLITARDDNGKQLSDDEIISHMITLVLAAHDTTTSSITWLLSEIACHPEVRNRLLAELHAVVGSEVLRYEHLSALSYTDCVLKEVERLHPAVTGAPRKAVKEFEFDGFHVPVGSLVYYSTIFTHMMPEVFREPERFDPDRFAAPREEDKRTPYSLIGFGGGSRSCIGQGFARYEMKIILSVLLKQYIWDIVPGQRLQPRYSPTKQPKDGLVLFFRKNN